MDKTLNYLGLARRSRHLISGTDAVVSALQSQKLYLIVLASDASNLTKDKINNKAYFYKVPVITNYTSSELSQATSLSSIVYGLDDKGFSEAILKDLKS